MRGKRAFQITPVTWALFALVLLLTEVAPEVVTAQEPYSIYNFSGGMNSVDNIFSVPPEQAQIVRNWNLDRYPGSLYPRPGFHALTSALPNHNEISAIFSHRFSNGQGYLFEVLRINTGYYADLKVSEPFSYDCTDSLYSYLYPTTGIWTVWNDDILFCNGRNRPLIISGAPSTMTADYVTPLAPGQAEVITLKQSGNLNGVYRYAFVAEVPCSTNYAFSKWCGPLSAPVRALNERILIQNLYPQIADSVCVAPGALDFLLVRTRGDHNNFDTDSLFVIDTFSVTNNWTNAQLWNHGDNLSDATLNNTYFWKTIREAQPPSGLNIQYLLNQEYPPLKNCYYSLGAPTFLDGDGGSTADTVSGYSSNWWVQYAVYLLDTLTGRTSDTSRALTYYNTEIERFQTKIGLPPCQSRYVRVVIKRLIDIVNDAPYYHGWYVLDTITSNAATDYTDTEHWRDLEANHDLFERNVLDVVLSGVVVHEGRLWGWDDQKIYISQSGTPYEWYQFDYLDVDLDDGDQNVRLVSYEGYLILYRHNSILIIYTQDGNVYNRSKKESGVGQIARQGFVNYNGANIFLDRKGISLETGNIYRDQSLSRRYISDNIRNYIVRSPDSMTAAAMRIFDDILLFSYPNTDTTWAHFFKTNGWSFWTYLDFHDAVMYDTLNRVNLAPFRDFCFVSPGSDLLYKLDYNDSLDEGGYRIYPLYEKRGIARSLEPVNFEAAYLRSDWLSNIDDTAAGDPLVRVRVYNEDGQKLDTLTFDSLSYAHAKRYVDQSTLHTAHWFNLQIEPIMNAVDKNITKVKIDGIDCIVKPVGID
ncbi:MAG: hypothetical protein AB1690_02435 [Candidatus Zixiibacteriota bacterium]